MTIAITGATGQLGRLVIDVLLRTRPASELVAVVRDADKAVDLAERGVAVRVAPYESRADLVTAFDGVDRLLFISGSEAGQRLTQHQNVVAAAIEAGVGSIVYTSAPRADDTDLVLAPEHKATEELIAASGLASTILRNNWYTENYAATVQQAAATGQFVGSAGDGRVASASRIDFAEATSVVLTTDGHQGAVYELGGDIAWTMTDLAAAISEVVGRPVSYVDLSHDEHVAALVEAGLPEGTAGFVAALDANIAAGALDGPTGEISRLIGRPSTPLVEGLRAVVPTRP